MSLDEYKEMFPSAIMEGSEWLQSNSISHIGQTAWNRGLDKTDSRVAHFAESLIGKERSLEHCQHISEAKKGYCPMAGWNKGLTKETNESMEKLANNKERSKAISKALTGRDITWGEKISQVKKEQFKDKEFAKRMVANITRHASSVRPNIPEQKVMAILDASYPYEWKYVGNCGLVLGGRIPDFVNVNGKKLLIELFGDYWHRNTNVQERIDYFKQFGFSTLVIWEHELKVPNNVENKIASFLSVETLHELPHAGKEKVRYF